MKEIRAGYAIIKRKDEAAVKLIDGLGIKTINIPLIGGNIMLVNPFEEVKEGIKCYFTHSEAELHYLYEKFGATHLATAVSGGYYIFITSLID